MKKILSGVCAFCLLFGITQYVYSLTGSEVVQKFQQKMYGVKTMQGTISLTYSSGTMFSGAFKYMAPGKFYIKFNNPPGKTIVSNNKKLWIYDAGSSICGIQELGRGLSGGIAYLVKGYFAITSSSGDNTVIKLKNSDRAYSEITLLVNKSFMPIKIIFKNKAGEGFSATLSNVKVNESLHAGIFDFNVPSNAQVIQNPLNIR